MKNYESRKLNGFLFSLNSHYLKHLIRVYKQFDGDIELCIVLGEIADYSASLVFPSKETRELSSLEVSELLRGCNAHSISLSSGIPRETVRRKVKKLISMGYIVMKEDKQIFLTQSPKEDLGEFSKETFTNFISYVGDLKKEGLI